MDITGFAQCGRAYPAIRAHSLWACVGGSAASPASDGDIRRRDRPASGPNRFHPYTGFPPMTAGGVEDAEPGLPAKAARVSQMTERS